MGSYIAVNEGRLKDDVLGYCSANGFVMTKQLLLGGLNDSTFSNMRNNYLRNKADVDEAYDICGVHSVGRLEEFRYKKILEIFCLKDKYRLPLYGTPTDNTVQNDKITTVDNSEIAEQLKNIELSINRLGNVVMQIMERMPKQTLATDSKAIIKKEIKKV